MQDPRLVPYIDTLRLDIVLWNMEIFLGTKTPICRLKNLFVPFLPSTLSTTIFLNGIKGCLIPMYSKVTIKKIADFFEIGAKGAPETNGPFALM